MKTEDPNMQLQKLLEQRGLSAEQQRLVFQSLQEVYQSGNQSEITQQDSLAFAHQLSRIIDVAEKIVEKPDQFSKLLGNRSRRSQYNLIVSISLIASLFGLALLGHFESSQTATIFGGIVGYLLGNYDG